LTDKQFTTVTQYDVHKLIEALRIDRKERERERERERKKGEKQ
jgi:hypothetical protein